MYTPGSTLWLFTITWIVLVASGATIPDVGVALNQLPPGPSACKSDDCAVAVAGLLLVSDQYKVREPGLLMVRLCALIFDWPSTAVNESRAGDKAITGPALGGKGCTAISTSTCSVGLTLDEKARSPLSSPR